MVGYLRQCDTDSSPMTNPTEALARECRELSLNTCLYTSATFFVWLRILRTTRIVLTAAAVICGALATWKALKHEYELMMAVFALLAAVIPPLQRSLGLDAEIDKYARLAGEFKNLQDRFRRAADIGSQKPFAEFEAEAKELFDRLDKARMPSATPPQLCFYIARWQIQRGYYTPDVAPEPK